MTEYYNNFIINDLNYPEHSHNNLLMSGAFDVNERPFNNIPYLSYILCSSPRSGSTYLCELLRNTGYAGIPFEYFNIVNVPKMMRNWNTDSFTEYLKILVRKRTGVNGIFGIKIHWHQFINSFQYSMHQIPEFKNLDLTLSVKKTFSNPHYVYISRNNKIRQAISLWKAKKTKIWDGVPLPDEKKQTSYSFKGIYRCLYFIKKEEENWKNYFKENQLSFFPVIYEDIIKNPLNSIKNIFSFLKIEIPSDFQVPEVTLRKQSDKDSEALVQQFEDDLRIKNLKSDIADYLRL